ncbi:MAG: hypothetical protein Q4A19_07220 [Johnsonella sp.]|nr:hypothetical protein [Johnsonella sp.]
MFRLAVQMYRSGFKERVLYFIGMEIAIIEIFVFLTIKRGIFEKIQWNLFGCAVLAEIAIFYYTLISIAVFSIYGSLRSYLFRRAREYQTLLLLGARGSQVMRLIIAEYIIGSFIAFLQGIFWGTILYYPLRVIINNRYENILGETAPSAFVYKSVAALSFVVVFLVAYIFFLWFNRRGMEDILMRGEKKNEYSSEPMRYVWILLIPGIVLFGLSRIIFRYFMVSFSCISMVFFSLGFGSTLISFYLIHIVLTKIEAMNPPCFSWNLRLLPLKENFYGMLWRVTVLSVIHIFALGFLAEKVADFIPVSAESYPFDAMVMVNYQRKMDFMDIAQKYEGKMQSYPMLRITDYNGVERIGVTSETYKALSGEEIIVSGREIIHCFQDQHARGEESPGNARDYYNMYWQIYVAGKYRGESWLKEKAKDPENHYVIKEVKINNIIGQWLIDFPNEAESLFVCSEEVFVELYPRLSSIEDEPTCLLLFLFPPETRDFAFAELSEKAEQSCPEYYGPWEQKYFYTYTESAAQIRRFRLSSLLAVLLLIVFMAASVFAWTVLNILSDIPFDRKKLNFLETLGMSRKELGRIFRYNAELPSCIALFITVFVAAINRKAYTDFLMITYRFDNTSRNNYWITVVVIYVLTIIILTKFFIKVIESFPNTLNKSRDLM